MDTATSIAPTGHPWVGGGSSNQVRMGIGYGAQFDMSLGKPWTTALEMVRAAEELGFDGYWIYDHPTRSLDCWSMLSALAVSTQRLRLGSLVSCVQYRSPMLLARCAADVDRLSGGRLVLGLGIGDDAAEAAVFGTSLPTVARRLRALEETIHVVRGLWAGRPFKFDGDAFQVETQGFGPGPVQAPSVPILIAGSGEKVTLRQVAQYADACNFGSHQWTGSVYGTDAIRQKYDALRTHCEALGRTYESILRTYTSLPVVVAPTRSAAENKWDKIPERIRTFYASSAVVGTVREVIDFYRPMVAAGVRYIVACVMGSDVDSLRLLADKVLPELQIG